MKQSHIKFTLFLLSILFFGFSCSKDNKPVSGITNRVLLSIQQIAATSDSVIVQANVSSDGGDAITERGICWSLSSNPIVTQGSFLQNGAGVGSFSTVIKTLQPNAVYYFRAYIKNQQGTVYSAVTNIKTLIRKATLTTNPISLLSHISAQSGGTFISNGGETPSKRGICWSSTNTSPTIFDNVFQLGSGSSNFSATMSNLLGGTRYYVRAYAENTAGVGYAGNVVEFQTQPAKIPKLGNISISAISRNSANAASSLTSAEGAPITTYGFCWSTTPNPTIANNRVVSNGPLTGSFSALISALTPGTTYYIRSYAINSAGPGYSPNTIIFQTLPLSLATVTTVSFTSIAKNSATFNGLVSDDGGAPVTERGFYVSTTTPPTTTSLKILAGSGLGAFSNSVFGLLSGTTYYFRAYAINSQGITLASNILSFTTLPPSLPTVITNLPTLVTSSGFTGGGNVTNDGGGIVTSRGFCWSTSPNPTLLNSFVTIGSGLGSFSTSVLSGLLPNTTYYVRAFATNGAGTSYGSQYQILTLLQTPNLSLPLNAGTIRCCNNTFSWAAVTGATIYDIELCKNSAFTGTIWNLSLCGGANSMNYLYLNKISSAVNSVCIGGGVSTNNGIWYWRVKARNASNSSDWSVVRTFSYLF